MRANYIALRSSASRELVALTMRRVHLGIVLLLFLQGLQLGLTLAVATEHAAEAALQVPDRTNREKHPFGSHLSLRRRAWLSMNTPRKGTYRPFFYSHPNQILRQIGFWAGFARPTLPV